MRLLRSIESVKAIVEQVAGNPADHLSGAVFSNGTSVYVVRVCISNQFLPPGVVHVSTINWNFSDIEKPIVFLFITITDAIEAWAVPYHIVPQEQRIIIRQTHNGYFINDVDISKYFKIFEALNHA